MLIATLQVRRIVSRSRSRSLAKMTRSKMQSRKMRRRKMQGRKMRRWWRKTRSRNMGKTWMRSVYAGALVYRREMLILPLLLNQRKLVAVQSSQNR